MNTRLRLIWYVLVGGVLLMSIRPGSSWLYQVISTNELNRWVHFLAYILLVAIPFASWKGRTGGALSLLVAALGIGLEVTQALISGPMLALAPDNVTADLFGVAAGTLLGYNIRLLRSSGTRPADVKPTTSSSSSVPAETTAFHN